MDIHPNDLLTLKKQHPCGSREWTVLRVGMDFRIRCAGCGREVAARRAEIEKSIKAVHRDGRLCTKEELAKTRTALAAEAARETDKEENR